jgi:hypothetical protein
VLGTRVRGTAASRNLTSERKTLNWLSLRQRSVSSWDVRSHSGCRRSCLAFWKGRRWSLGTADRPPQACRPCGRACPTLDSKEWGTSDCTRGRFQTFRPSPRAQSVFCRNGRKESCIPCSFAGRRVRRDDNRSRDYTRGTWR